MLICEGYSPIVLSGPSGAGKTELIEYLKKKNKIFEEAPGITTRPRRIGEVGNTDFITQEKFFEYVNNDELIQYVRHDGNYYGTLKKALELLKDKQILFNMGYQGAVSLKNIRPDSSLIYILPPNKEEVLRRMGNRGIQRYSLGIEQTKKSIDLYDYLLISYTDNMEKLYCDFMDIYESSESGKTKSLKLIKNKDFMKNFYN